MDEDFNEILFLSKLANTILENKDITISKTNENVLAFCNLKKKEIFFNFNVIKYISKNQIERLILLKGLLFHEIMHLKHTTFSSKRLSASIIHILDFLEEGRIETLGVLEYNKLIDYYVFLINNYLLTEGKKIFSNKNNLLLNYILLYGRHHFYFSDFLVDFRKELILEYGFDFIDLLENKIDDYISEKTDKKRIEIAEEIANLLLKKGVLLNNKVYPERVIITSSNISNSETKSELDTMMKEILNKTKELKKELNKKTKISQQEIEEYNKNKKLKEKRISELEKEKEKLLKECYDERVVSKRLKLSEKIYNIEKEIKKIGEYNQNKLTIPNTQLQNQQELIKEKINSDILFDIKNINNSNQTTPLSNFNINENLIQKAKKLEKCFKKLNNHIKKRYVSNNLNGRINIKDYFQKMGKYGYINKPNIFYKFKEDRSKETKLLVNLFIDASGSMTNQDRWEKAINTAFVIHKALDKDKNKVLITIFSDDYHIIKDYDQKNFLKPSLLGGRTFISNALSEIFFISEKYKKQRGYKEVVNIIITDGYFDDFEQTKSELEKLEKLKHINILINVSYKGENLLNIKHFIYLDNFDLLADKLIDIFTKLKMNLIKKVI